MTWARDKDKIVGLILGLISAAVVGGSVMLVAHEAALSSHGTRIKNNERSVDRVETNILIELRRMNDKMDRISERGH